jgi:hypothetical protein
MNRCTLAQESEAPIYVKTFIIDIIPSSLKLVLKVGTKNMSLLRRVMEGSIIFYQNNILEHSLSFHGDYKKRCILTSWVSQIL